MTANRAFLYEIEPIQPDPARDPAACLREAARALAMGGLEEAARYARMAAEVIDAHKRAH